MWHHFNYEHAAEMRKKYIPVERVLEVANLSKEDVVMDVGAGDGFYTFLFSEHVKKVIYVDPSEPAAKIAEKRKGGVDNVEIRRENICEIELPDGVTKVFFSNSFHDMKCKDRIIEDFSKSSDCNLEFVLVEFRKDADIGPPVHVKLGTDELDALFMRYGYEATKREIFEKHYVTRYTKVNQK